MTEADSDADVDVNSDLPEPEDRQAPLGFSSLVEMVSRLSRGGIAIPGRFAIRRRGPMDGLVRATHTVYMERF